MVKRLLIFMTLFIALCFFAAYDPSLTTQIFYNALLAFNEVVISSFSLFMNILAGISVEI
jgi:hypothetical protein